jgi:hypothetical protein
LRQIDVYMAAKRTRTVETRQLTIHVHAAKPTFRSTLDELSRTKSAQGVRNRKALRLPLRRSIGWLTTQKRDLHDRYLFEISEEGFRGSEVIHCLVRDPRRCSSVIEDARAGISVLRTQRGGSR